MKITKIISVLLALTLIVALVGCGGNKRKVVQLTLSTEDAEAILAAAGVRLPDVETAKGAGTTVKWFAHYDVFQNYSEDELVNTGAWTFIEKYGGSFEWRETTWGARWDDLALDLMAGTPSDMFPGETGLFPNYIIKGMFQPVSDYIDFDDPLWTGVRDISNSYFNIGGDIYAGVYSAGVGTIIPYNRRVIQEHGFEDPAQLFYNDEWTWDKFSDMCLEFNDPDADRYALDGYFWRKALLNSAGKNIVELDPETCQFYSNVDDAGLERAANVIYELSRNECVYPRWNNNNWTTRNDGVEGAGVKEGDCLFWMVASWGLIGSGKTLAENEAVWGDFHQEEVMFVPVPRDPQGDGKYYMEATPNAYAIINGAPNPEGAALVCCCERFKAMDPIVKQIDRKQTKEKLLVTDEMLDMLDLCTNLANGDAPIVDYGEGMGSQINEVCGKFQAMGENAPVSWAQVKEAQQERLDYYITDFNASIQKFIDRGGTFEN